MKIVFNQFIQNSNVQIKEKIVLPLGEKIPIEYIFATKYGITDYYMDKLIKKKDYLEPAQKLLKMYFDSTDFNQQFSYIGSLPTIPQLVTQNQFGQLYKADYAGIQIIDQNQNQIIQIGQYINVYDQNSQVIRIIQTQQNQFQIAAITESNNLVLFDPLTCPCQIIENANINQDLTKITSFKDLYWPLNNYMYTITQQYIPQYPDSIFGSNFFSLDGIQISKKGVDMSIATIIDILTAKICFIQGQFYQIDTMEPIQFRTQLNKDNIQTYYALTLQDQEYSQYFDNFIRLNLKEIQNTLSYIKECNYIYSDKENQQNITQYVTKQRKLHCAFCNRVVENPVVLIYSLVKQSFIPIHKTFIPPVLACFCKECISTCPEVTIDEYKLTQINTSEESSTSEQEFHKLQEVEKRIQQCNEYQPIDKLLIYDKFIRHESIVNQNINYGSIRKACDYNRIITKCTVCKKPGGVVGCYDSKCNFTAHYWCCKEQGMQFESNGKTTYCIKHQKKLQIDK